MTQLRNVVVVAAAAAALITWLAARRASVAHAQRAQHAQQPAPPVTTPAELDKKETIPYDDRAHMPGWLGARFAADGSAAHKPRRSSPLTQVRTPEAAASSATPPPTPLAETASTSASSSASAASTAPAHAPKPEQKLLRRAQLGLAPPQSDSPMAH